MSGHNTGAVLEGKITTRGTSNGNDRGNTRQRRARREWLIATYAADRELVRVTWAWGDVTIEPYVVPVEGLRLHEAVVEAYAVPTCRCYRCGKLLCVDTVTVDRIVPGCKGGTYRRDNIRPACGHCNSETGGRLGAERRAS